MKRLMRNLTVLLIVLAFALPSLAFAPQGEVSAGTAFEWNSDEEKVEHTSARTGFRLILEDSLDSAGKLHLSAHGWWDWKQKEGEIGPDQVWFAGYAGDVDYTLGRQLISWGTADGFNPTSYFDRMDMDALYSGDLTGRPVWAGLATYYGLDWSVAGVVSPVFEAQKIDDQMKKMMPEISLPEGLPPFVEGFLPSADDVLEAIEAVPKPKAFGKDVQWAVRAETQLAGFDLQASYFSGYEPLPGLQVLIEAAMPPVVEFTGEYRRQRFLGLAASGTIGSAGIWGEVSYGGPESFEGTGERIPLSINEKYFQAVVGGDYTLELGKGLLIQAQYIYRGQGSLFMPYAMPDIELNGFMPDISPGEIKPAHYLYGRLGYSFSADSSADLILLHGFEEEGGLIRPSYTYRFPNSLQLELSAVKTYGKEGAAFASIPLQGRLALSYKF